MILSVDDDDATPGDGADSHDGIDRKQLQIIKQRFLALNRERYLRTLSVLSERQQQFLALLPLLFHVNHPMLPGYTGHQVPVGVHAYSPAKDDIRIAKMLARSFTWQRDLAEKSRAIDAIYVMGSSGTIAHSESSDIDVWVCHSSELAPAALAGLQEKCNSLAHWATDVIHIETHFFLMDSELFSRGQQRVLSNDASGSAQHYLLLDEFYRTAVWLAGKLPLWWFVPAEAETDYSTYTHNLLAKRFLRAADVIDFGGVPEIPTNEFIGAGVWQLYKGIDSPYKSVLKLLLLEAYSTEKFSEPLSLDLKRKIYQKDNNTALNVDELDAYVLVYQRLEHYLLAQNQLARLELVRRCFYFKAGRNLSRTSRASAKSWQRILLEQLVQRWGWQQSRLTILDNRVYWKSPHVLAEHNLLANELNQAYRLLVEMNKNTVGDAAISSNELLILGRKLHAAFERKAGKIDWINPGISRDLSEPALYFLHTIENNTPLWQVYRGSQQDFLLRDQVAEPIKRSRNFMELLLWCYCNRILASNTRLDIASKDFTLQNVQRQQLWQILQQWLPLPQPPSSHDAFTHNAHPASLLLLLNIGTEPQADLQRKGMQMLSGQRDAFGYSGIKENLVLTADIVQRNNWGEIICRHFGSDAIVNCLLYYLRVIPPHKNIGLPELTVRCLSAGRGAIIEQRVLELWRAIITCFYSSSRTRAARFIFEMADDYLLLQFMQQQPHISRFKTYEKLLEKLEQPQITFSPLVIDNFALRDKSLRLFCEAMDSPGVYLFYRVDNDFVEVTIIDYNGAVFSKAFALFTIQALLRPLCRFIRSTSARQAVDNDHAYDLATVIDALPSIRLFELSGDPKQKNAYLEPRTIGKDVSQLKFINICAVAEPAPDHQLAFTIFCDGKEFSALEYGSELFAAVARYILSCRQYGETYPCYITDLDLSLCRDFIAPNTGVQLIHYLHIKYDIESRLNAALRML